jgi:hypothetical protein
MPFILIHGTFHLVGRTQAGNPTGFEPDGDSIQFQPANPALLDQLDQLDQPARPYRLSSTGSTQLRLEAIDALELHFDSTHQPRPLADQARDFFTGKLGLNPVPYRPPKLLQVKPPVLKDATPGFILSRSLEVNGRPIAFAFTSAPPRSTRRRSAARAAARGGQGGQMVCRPYRTRSSRARSGRSPAWPGR